MRKIGLVLIVYFLCACAPFSPRLSKKIYGIVFVNVNSDFDPQLDSVRSRSILVEFTSASTSSTSTMATAYALGCVQHSDKIIAGRHFKVVTNKINFYVFAWLPTGYGKSLCFQLLPFVFDFELGKTITALRFMHKHDRISFGIRPLALPM